MPAPYRKKDSILEMSDRERESRRQAELARPERHALVGVYPEEFLIPALKASKETVKGVRSAIANKVDMAMRPKVENALVADFLRGAGKGTYGVRNVFSDAELENIKKTGYMLPSPKEIKSGKNRKWFTHTDNPTGQTLRVKAENIPPNRAVRRRDVEIYNPEKDAYEPFKQGGAVKAKKHRGDGIAQRGKTRGRMI